MTKQTKTKIGVGSVVKAKVGELEKITREGRRRRMRKEVMGCVQRVGGKNNFLILFEDGQKKEIGSCSLVYLSEKEEIEMEESITLLPKTEECVPLTINGDPPDGEPCMFLKGMYLSIFIVCAMIPIYLQIYWYHSTNNKIQKNTYPLQTYKVLHPGYHH